MRVVALCGYIGIGIGVLFSSFTLRHLEVVFLDVGQGDAILVTSPSGRQILIDAGVNQRILRALGKEMSFFDRGIDVVLATHPDADHIGGFPAVFERFDIERVVRTEAVSETSIYEAFVSGSSEAEVVYLSRGSVIDLGAGVYVQVLFPLEGMVAGGNDGSIVAKVIYGDTSFLLTGDAGIGVEEYVIQEEGDLLASDVLKAGHHGSRTSTSEEFVSVVSPEVSIISAGEDNYYGHPHEEVLERLSVYLETSKEGNITFVSDGERLWRE